MSYSLPTRTLHFCLIKSSTSGARGISANKQTLFTYKYYVNNSVHLKLRYKDEKVKLSSQHDKYNKVPTCYV